MGLSAAAEESLTQQGTGYETSVGGISTMRQALASLWDSGNDLGACK